MSNRPLLITTGRHPFQVAIVTAVPLAVLPMLVTGRRPDAVGELPEPYATVWLSMLAFGGLAALVGAYWRGSVDTAMAIEGGAMTMTAAGLTLYVVMAALTIGPAALLGQALVIGITTASWWRLVQIGRDLHKLLRATRGAALTQLTVLAEGDHHTGPAGPAGGTGGGQ